eukprot:INCI16178.3.p1 GENE.INCI16178.3~~INCI16178.3.p1  ORF type:complete len:517 (+),score=87.20 INCI16178.3:272-1822(+)
MDKGGSVGLNTQKALYVALWDYNAIEEDELQLSKGDMVCASVDYLENSFGEWMVGENTRGKIGKFPATYVRAVTAESAASAPLAMNSNFDPDSVSNNYNGASVLMTKADKSLRKFLKDNRAYHFYEPLVELGVENMRDLKLVLPSDLYEIGMDEDTITRILAVTKTPAGSPTNSLGGTSTLLGGQDNVRPENTHRKHSIARAIVSSLSQTELQMLKDYLAECAPDNGPAGGNSEEAEAENGGDSSNKPLPAKSALTSDQQTVLMSYVTAQFDALVQFQHIHRLFKNLFFVKTNLSAADLEAEEEEVPRRQSVVQEMEAHESFAERFTSAISQRRRSLGNTRALRPDMLQDGSCRFCRKLCKEVLAKLVEEQEALCGLLRAHALEAGCGDAILKHVRGTSGVYKAFADLQPRVQVCQTAVLVRVACAVLSQPDSPVYCVCRHPCPSSAGDTTIYREFGSTCGVCSDRCCPKFEQKTPRQDCTADEPSAHSATAIKFSIKESERGCVVPDASVSFASC